MESFYKNFKTLEKKRPDMVEGRHEHFSLYFFHYITYVNKTKRPRLLEKISQVDTEQTSVHHLKK